MRRRRLRVADLETLARRGTVADALTDRDHRVRAAAIPIVAKHTPDVAAELLVPCLGDSEWLVRQAAIKALGDLGASAIPAILEKLEEYALDSDPGLPALGAAEVLIRIAALLDSQERPRAIAGIDRLTAASGDVGRAARDALAALTVSHDSVDPETREQLRHRLLHRRSICRAEARRDLAWIASSADELLRSAYEASQRLDDVLAGKLDSSESITSLESVVAAEPVFTAARLALARLHRTSGCTEEATRHAAAAVSDDDRSAAAWTELGLVHAAASDAPAALSAFVTAIALDPEFAGPRLRRHVEPLLERLEAWDLLTHITEYPIRDDDDVVPSNWNDAIASASVADLWGAMFTAVDHLQSGASQVDWLPHRVTRRSGEHQDHSHEIDVQSRTVRVFISSTFRDFHAERDLLVRRVFPELRRRFKERLVDVVDVDLRWGIRQEDAERGEALALCLAELDRCRPFFVGLLGQAFGTPVEEAKLAEYSWIREPGPHSFTELEIRYALRTTQSPECLFYFRDPAYLRRLSPEDRPDFVSPSEREAEALATLKDEIRTHVSSSSGSRPKEYQHPRQLGDLVLEDLSSEIDRRFPASKVPDRATQRRVHHAATAERLTRIYAPRERDLTRLDEHVQRRGAPLVVIGGPGSGKSSLLANWARRSRMTDPSLRIVEHYVADAASAETPDELIAHIASELDCEYAVSRMTDDRETGRSMAEVLRRASSERDVVVLVDGVDRLRPTRGRHPLSWIPQPVPDGVWLVCTVGPGEIADELRRRRWVGYTLTELTESERMLLIDTYLDRFGKKLQPDLIDRLVTAPQCSNPRFLSSLLEELRMFGRFPELAGRTASYLEATTVENLYDMVLEQLEAVFAQDAPGLVEACFTNLWASRRGLTEGELIEATQRGTHEAPRRVWSTLLAAIDAWVGSAAGRISIRSASFRSAVEARYLTSPDARRSAHRRLIALFAKGESDREGEELAWHLTRAEEWERLLALLADPAKVAALHESDASATLEYWAAVEAATGRSRQDAYAPVIARPERYAKSVWQIADILEDGGLVEPALRLRQWIAEQASGVDDPRSRAAAVGDLGIALRLHGDWRDALDQFREQERLARAAGDGYLVTNALTNTGLVLADLGNLSEALRKHEEAEEMCRAQDDWIGLSTALGNQALVLAASGDLERAESLLDRQVQVSRQVDDIEGVILGLGNLGSAKLQQGHLEDALEDFTEAERLARKLGARHALVRTLTNLGSVAAEQGRLDDALRLQQESAAICREIGDDVGLAGALGNQSVVMHRKGDLEAALELTRAEERICRRLGHIPGLAHSMMQQATLFADKREHHEAIRCVLEARRLWRDLGDRPNLKRVAHLLSDLGMDEEAAAVALEATLR